MTSRAGLRRRAPWLPRFPEQQFLGNQEGLTGRQWQSNGKTHNSTRKTDVWVFPSHPGLLLCHTIKVLQLSSMGTEPFLPHGWPQGELHFLKYTREKIGPVESDSDVTIYCTPSPSHLPTCTITPKHVHTAWSSPYIYPVKNWQTRGRNPENSDADRTPKILKPDGKLWVKTNPTPHYWFFKFIVNVTCYHCEE